MQDKIANIKRGTSTADKFILQKLRLHYEELSKEQSVLTLIDASEKYSPILGGLSEKNIIQLQKRLIEVQEELLKSNKEKDQRIEFLEDQIANIYGILIDNNLIEVLNQITNNLDIEKETKLLNHIADGIRRELVSKVSKQKTSDV